MNTLEKLKELAKYGVNWSDELMVVEHALPDLIEVVEAAKWVRETTNHAYVLNQAAVKGALDRLDAALAKLEGEV